MRAVPHEPSHDEHGIDLTLIDDALAMTPRERLLQNDAILKTIEMLEQGFAARERADDDRR
jgi:hypothetical protein